VNYLYRGEEEVSEERECMGEPGEEFLEECLEGDVKGEGHLDAEGAPVAFLAMDVFCFGFDFIGSSSGPGVLKGDVYS